MQTDGDLWFILSGNNLDYEKHFQVYSDLFKFFLLTVTCLPNKKWGFILNIANTSNM